MSSTSPNATLVPRAPLADEPPGYSGSPDLRARYPELDVWFTREGQSIVVSLTGELDIYTVPGLRRQLSRHDHPDTSLVVDLTGMTLIDSAGLGLLVSLRNMYQARNRGVALVLQDERFANLLRIAGLADAFVQAATVNDACAALAA